VFVAEAGLDLFREQWRSTDYGVKIGVKFYEYDMAVNCVVSSVIIQNSAVIFHFLTMILH